MKRSVEIFCFCLLISFKLWSQESINNYKYVIIPTKYSMFDADDKYQLNSLTKFLFNKYGYTAFLKSDPFPEELNMNPCLGLSVELEKHSGFLNTKVQIHLYDCKQRLVMSSKIGSSRIKDYKKAYNVAIRNAFSTFQNINYKYEEIEDGNETKNYKVKINEERNTKKENNITQNKKENVAEIELKIEEVEPGKKLKVEISQKLNILYAQPITNGFQLVDTTPKKVMILLETGIENTFIVKGKDSVVTKKDGNWVIIENDGQTIESKILTIKF